MLGNTEEVIIVLAKEIERIVVNNGGIEAVTAHYDSVYSECFATESSRICDYLNAFTNTQEEYYTVFNEMCGELRESALSAMFEAEHPHLFAEEHCARFDDDDEDEDEDEDDYHDHYDDGRSEFIDVQRCRWEDINKDKHNALLVIREDTLICDLTNYKGEGEGIALASMCANLRVFRGKHASFSF